jgi:acetyltransferase
MTIRNLNRLFRPQSVAVVGATNRPGAVGNIVMRNILSGGFAGPVMPVNPKYEAVAGVLAYPDVDSLPKAPDMAVVCTPPEPIPGLIETLGARGTRAAIILTAGLDSVETPDGATVTEAMLSAARPHLLRILGPNCVGALVPGIGLNASFAHLPALADGVAFASQSGALCTAVLDWARQNDVGFSHFISLGNMADVDFGDVVDYLASDPDTDAILLYVEAVTNGRKFLSACRAAARNKPVLVIKSGAVAEGAKAAATHTGALAGSDRVYDAAFRRAGLLRVYDIDELFAGAETVARARPQRGERLAILTNGGGIGVMATDELVQRGGVLATPSEETLAALDNVLPATWSRSNPVDIIGDAPGERYAAAVRILAQAKECDAVLVMHAPTATADSVEAAQAVVDAAKETKRNLLTCWVGGQAVAPARRLFHDSAVPTYESPRLAIQAFMHLVNYQRSQTMLMETPPSAPHEFTRATDTARLIVESQLVDGGDMMNEPEAKAVLAAYGIPTVETHIAKSPAEAAEKAAPMGFPVALKILSDDITHKSDVGGVDLFLDSKGAVEAAAARMLETVKQRAPDARIEGFSVQRMAERPGAYETFVGVTSDAVFGPVIVFGHGGTEVEVVDDSAVALPPLNMALARDLVERTRIARLLRGFRDRPPVDMAQLYLTLMQVSQLIVDIPEIAEIDINPLLVDENGVLALDARIRVAAPTPSRRLAIRPYPERLEETVTFASVGKLTVRPIRPEDEPEHYAFLSKLAPEDIRFRFFGSIRELPHTQMARLTQIDFDREMALIATGTTPEGGRETLGVVRTIADPDNERCEFAIVVRSDMKGQGLGCKLLEKMIRYCRERGTQQMVGQILPDNKAMLGLAEQFGFRRRTMAEEGVVEVTLDLQDASLPGLSP